MDDPNYLYMIWRKYLVFDWSEIRSSGGMCKWGVCGTAVSHGALVTVDENLMVVKHGFKVFNGISFMLLCQ